MCKYCNKKSLNRVELDTDGGKWSPNLYMESIDGKTCIFAYGEDVSIYYPKFCPECGRKLI